MAKVLLEEYRAFVSRNKKLVKEITEKITTAGTIAELAEELLNILERHKDYKEKVMVKMIILSVLSQLTHSL